MSLQFVLGSSGSGKTEYLFRQVVTEAGQNPKKDYLVLVPEQFTMETQQTENEVRLIIHIPER